jgi:hypothetical protein
VPRNGPPETASFRVRGHRRVERPDERLDPSFRRCALAADLFPPRGGAQSADRRRGWGAERASLRSLHFVCRFKAVVLRRSGGGPIASIHRICSDSRHHMCHPGCSVPLRIQHNATSRGRVSPPLEAAPVTPRARCGARHRHHRSEDVDFRKARRCFGRGAGGRQGLTLLHFTAQLERLLWDRGCA